MRPSGSKIFLVVMIALLGVGIFLLVVLDNSVSFSNDGGGQGFFKEALPEEPDDPNADIGPQAQLTNPPTMIKAIYSTAWSAGSEKKMDYFLDLFNTTELNAIVIDIKDYTGIMSYEPDVAMVKEIGAYETRIDKINKLIKRLHDDGVYVIARVSTFQDKALAKARPELAVQSKASGSQWQDRNGLMWTNPVDKRVWDYNIAIAMDAFNRGFDEVNFDYMRFPSDGNIGDLSFSGYDGTVARDKMIAQFFGYLRSQLIGHRISADLFGEVTYARGDIGVGQNLKLALNKFDYIAPMTYPSHYNPNFQGLNTAATHPYEVLKYSMDQVFSQLIEVWKANQPLPEPIGSSTEDLAVSVPPKEVSNADLQSMVSTKFRPWLQDFDLGAVYTADMVRAQMRGVYDAGFVGYDNLDAEAFKNGWMLWDAGNNYMRAALLPE